jgi:hypothetical protein
VTLVELGWAGWPSGVTEAVLSAADALASAPSGEVVTLVVPVPPAVRSEREALRDALRSVLHASLLERPDVRANIVFGGDEADSVRTIAYLASADFVYGATIDLEATA